MIRKRLTARQYSNPMITGFRSRSLGPGDLKINKIDSGYQFQYNPRRIIFTISYW